MDSLVSSLFSSVSPRTEGDGEGDFLTTGLAFGVGVTFGLGVGEGVGLGVGVGEGEGVGDGEGLGDGEGDGSGDAVLLLAPFVATAKFTQVAEPSVWRPAVKPESGAVVSEP